MTLFPAISLTDPKDADHIMGNINLELFIKRENNHGPRDSLSVRSRPLVHHMFGFVRKKILRLESSVEKVSSVNDLITSSLDLAAAEKGLNDSRRVTFRLDTNRSQLACS